MWSKEMEDEDEDTAVQCKVKVLSKSSSKLVLDQLAIGDRRETGSGKSHIDIKGKCLRTSCDGLEE